MTPLTRRATACYRQATPVQILDGANWYPDAHAIARNQATTHRVTIEVAAGVIAALSPRCNWGRNVMLAERVLASGGTLARGGLPRNLAWARAVHAGAPAMDVLNGPKTRAFYWAILTGGTSPDPVIDSHAWDMLTGQRGAEYPSARQYREASARMIAAARILDRPVHHVQATTWLVHRERFWRPDAFAVSPQSKEES